MDDRWRDGKDPTKTGNCEKRYILFVEMCVCVRFYVSKPWNNCVRRDSSANIDLTLDQCWQKKKKKQIFFFTHPSFILSLNPLEEHGVAWWCSSSCGASKWSQPANTLVQFNWRVCLKCFSVQRRLCVCSLVMWEIVVRKLAGMPWEDEAGDKNENFNEKCFLLLSAWSACSSKFYSPVSVISIQ